MVKTPPPRYLINQTAPSTWTKCGYCRRWECSCSSPRRTGGPDDEIAQYEAIAAECDPHGDDLILELARRVSKLNDAALALIRGCDVCRRDMLFCRAHRALADSLISLPDLGLPQD